MVTSTTLIDLLREVYNNGDIEMEVRSYSGRGMYGKECVAVVIGGYTSAWTLALAIADVNGGNADLFGLEAPRQDSMGLGTVLYWPQLEWPAGMKDFGGEDEGDDGEY